VIGPESPEGHVTQKYTNSIVGRYANRIPVGRHILERNGLSSELVTLSNGMLANLTWQQLARYTNFPDLLESPLVSLHGGPIGFDALPWARLSCDTPPELFSPAELAHIHTLSESSYAIFCLKSPSGDQGFPGAIKVEALIALMAPEKTRPMAEYSLGSIVLVYRARLEDTKVVTPINLTQVCSFVSLAFKLTHR
jgi:aldose 1-epimerase